MSKPKKRSLEQRVKSLEMKYASMSRHVKGLSNVLWNEVGKINRRLEVLEQAVKFNEGVMDAHLKVHDMDEKHAAPKVEEGEPLDVRPPKPQKGRYRVSGIDKTSRIPAVNVHEGTSGFNIIARFYGKEALEADRRARDYADWLNSREGGK